MRRHLLYTIIVGGVWYTRLNIIEHISRYINKRWIEKPTQLANHKVDYLHQITRPSFPSHISNTVEEDSDTMVVGAKTSDCKISLGIS